jgi:HAMP domain-containing protein
MAEIREEFQDKRVDARNLWLPVTVIASAILILGGAIWWAATINTTVAAMAGTLARIEANVGEATALKRTITQNQAEIEELQLELKKQREYWEVDTRNLNLRIDRIARAVQNEHGVRLDDDGR